MESVFGSGRVKDLFAPEASGHPGAITLTARGKLNECTVDLDTLEKSEAGVLTADSLCASAQRRCRVLGNVEWIYDHDSFEALTEDANVRTLDFESDDVPLWLRIRRASLFVEFVRRAEQSIRSQGQNLASKMRDESATLSGFPISLFTLSLERLEHILDGALAPVTQPGATERLQANEPGSLRQNLRNLKVADATTQLELLAREVGLDLTSGATRSLVDCEGHIAAAFRDVRVNYEMLQDGLVQATEHLEILKNALHNPPADFRYPSHVPPFERLGVRPDQICELLEDTRSEEVERLRSAFEAPSRLGNFQPLMAQARSLLDEPRDALTALLAAIQSVENVVTEYRQRLLASAELQKAQRGIEALSLAVGDPSPRQLTAKDLELAGALSSAVQNVQKAIHDAASSGAHRLFGTGISFERWGAVVFALDAGRDPELETQEAASLVDGGFIQRTYRLGVRA
jgi:hypothetical protein